MTLPPLVSVIIPTYNRSEMLVQAVRSVLNQTFNDLELIVVDDGSTDNTEERITQLKKNDHRVRYLSNNKNLGSQASRNIGVQAAVGKYVALLDSDDEWLPKKLAVQINIIRKTPYPCVIHAGYRKIIHQPNDYSIDMLPPKDFNEKMAYSQILTGYNPHLITIIVEKDAIQKVGGFNEAVRAYQEWELNIRLSKAYSYRFINEVLAIYHIHSEPSISKDLGLSANGYLDVITTHREEMIEVCGKKTMAMHYARAGRLFIEAGKLDQANACFKQARFVYPTYPKAFVYQFLGARLYQKLADFRSDLRNEM